jgi:cytosine/adenosine deaminase-related metal-dependent hydrolase
MGTAMNLEGYERRPGMINAHDHLEFNLFPKLGSGYYRNATEWARDIHHPERSPVREHVRVPKDVRLWWGGLKNLVSGVTTVGHHNPYEPTVFGADFPVRVVRRMTWAHSLAIEPDLRGRLRDGWPFLIHCGEGTDAASRREVAMLDAQGVLDARTAIVHGVGLTRAGIDLMRQRGAALIWCPTSNLGMLGRTISRDVLRSGLPIALATDSALSAPVDLLDEIKVAQKFVPTAELYQMVTSVPARILRLPKRKDDWIAVRVRTGAVALVVIGGRIRLISPELSRQLPASERRRFQKLHLEGREPVLVDADVRRLRRAAAKHLGDDLRLAGKRILK